MKHQFLRSFLLLLAILMMLSALASCQNGNTNPEVPTEAPSVGAPEDTPKEQTYTTTTDLVLPDYTYAVDSLDNNGILPATRDVNALFCAHWDTDINYLGNAYVVGLNGWYEGKSGIERSPETGLRTLTGAYTYTPGSEVHIVTGIVDGHSFLYADDVLVSELIDPHAISGGHVGFSPYSTALAFKDIEVRRGVWTAREQSYIPEF
jgi:hypothetical protein